jgi:hypothetical protein
MPVIPDKRGRFASTLKSSAVELLMVRDFAGKKEG